jgi:hypothetical protein
VSAAAPASDTVATESAAPAATLEPLAAVSRPRYRRALVVCVAILSVIAVVAALYLARAFFVPLLIGILASYALSPLVDWLQARRIPRAAGAALVLAALVSAAAWAVLSMGDDAASLIAKLPEAARKMRHQVGEARESGPTALQKIQEAAPSCRVRRPTRPVTRRSRSRRRRRAPLARPKPVRGFAITCWRSRHCSSPSPPRRRSSCCSLIS